MTPGRVMPQLLNVASDADVARLVASPDWVMQEKLDGRRMMLHKSGDTVGATNKLGLSIDVPAAIVNAARKVDGEFIIDGEIIGDQLHAFDLLSHAEVREQAYGDRYTALVSLLAGGGKAIGAVGAVIDPAEKADRFLFLKTEGGR